MSQSKLNLNSWISVLPSLVVPLCFGLTLYVGMLALIRHGLIENETLLRYLTGHPVSKISVAMFLIGASSLGLIAINVFAQFASERELRFVPVDKNSQSDGVNVDDAQCAVALGQQLLEFPRSVQAHYLWQRLTNSLLYVYRNGSAKGVDEEVKYLAELDLDRQQQRYALVRILIWATPMLGFLGTVLGISQALGGIAVGSENDFQSMMDGLRSSLYVAFDTTALALTLSMILMFTQFLVDRFETQLLALVDQRARAEIAGQFESATAESVDQSSAEQLGQYLLKATREMMVAQTDIWKKTIQSAEDAWAATLSETNERVRSNWLEAVEKTFGRMNESLDGSIERANASMTHRWEQWQVMLSDNARIMSKQQQELVAQTMALQSLVNESGCDVPLQEMLTRTLEAIATTEELTLSVNRLSEQVETVLKPKKLVVAQPDDEAQVALSEFTSEAPTDAETAEREVIFDMEQVNVSKRLGVTRRQLDSRSESLEEVILPIGPYLSGQKTTQVRHRSRLTKTYTDRKAA